MLSVSLTDFLRLFYRLQMQKNVNTAHKAQITRFPLPSLPSGRQKHETMLESLQASICDLALTFQLLPQLFFFLLDIKTPQCTMIMNWRDGNICLVYLRFNRKLFIQHKNHKILQNVRFYHAVIFKKHSVTGRLHSFILYPDLLRHLEAHREAYLQDDKQTSYMLLNNDLQF